MVMRRSNQLRISSLTTCMARALGLRLPSMRYCAPRSLMPTRCARLSAGLLGQSVRTTAPNLEELFSREFCGTIVPRCKLDGNALRCCDSDDMTQRPQNLTTELNGSSS